MLLFLGVPLAFLASSRFLGKIKPKMWISQDTVHALPSSPRSFSKKTHQLSISNAKRGVWQCERDASRGRATKQQETAICSGGGEVVLCGKEPKRDEQYAAGSATIFEPLPR
jgi:hypothetical protein